MQLQAVFSKIDTTTQLLAHNLRFSCWILQPYMLAFSMFPKAISQPFLLEVERKFCGLAVTDLTLHVGNPPFRSIQPQSQRIFSDTYFDRAGLLTAAGV